MAKTNKARWLTVPEAADEILKLQRSAAEQARAGMSGAADAFTMGAADPVTSALRATFDPDRRAWGERYNANMRAAQTQDKYDAEHHPLARTVGQGVGTVGAVAALGATPFGAAGAVGRLAPTAGRLIPHAGHVLRLTGSVGAAGGVVGQGVSDLASGRRSSLTDYAGAALGGGIGGLAAPYLGAAQGSAVAGGAIPAVQAALSGRLPSMDAVSQGAVGGALLGTVLGGAGARNTARWSNKNKGDLGEILSLASSITRGEVPIELQKQVALKGGSLKKGYIKADHQTHTGRLVEAKFGLRAGFTPNQKKAIAEGLAGFTPEHWLPRDIAAILGVGSSASVSGQAGRPAQQVGERVKR